MVIFPRPTVAELLMLCVFDEIVLFPHLLFVDLMEMNDRGELQVLLDPLQQNIDNPKA